MLDKAFLGRRRVACAVTCAVAGLVAAGCGGRSLPAPVGGSATVTEGPGSTLDTVQLTLHNRSRTPYKVVGRFFHDACDNYLYPQISQRMDTGQSSNPDGYLGLGRLPAGATESFVIEVPHHADNGGPLHLYLTTPKGQTTEETIGWGLTC